MQNDNTVTGITELTAREKEILRLVATGTSNKEIARQLSISSNTVKVHVRNIFAKIGVATRTEAALYAVRTGVTQETISPPETVFSTNGMDLAPPRSWLSRHWVVLTVVVLVLGLVAGGGIYLTQRPASPSVVSPASSPTAASRWQTLAAMPTARSGLAVAAFENQIYAIGGETLQDVTGAMESYNLETNSWQKKPSKPLAVTDVGAAVIGGKIYVPGGRLSSGEVTNALEIYDPRLGSWVRGTDLPMALSAYASVAFEGRLYLFGGWDGKQYLNSVLVYDPNQDAWLPHANMPTRCGFAGAAVVGDKIYVLGGFDGKQALAINEIYTPHLEGIDSPWSKANPFPDGQYGLGIASVADNIYVISGQETSRVFWAYIPQTDHWQVIDSPPLDIGEGARLVQLGEFLLILGGKVKNIPTGENLAYQAIYTVQIPLIINK